MDSAAYSAKNSRYMKQEKRAFSTGIIIILQGFNDINEGKLPLQVGFFG